MSIGSTISSKQNEILRQRKFYVDFFRFTQFELNDISDVFYFTVDMFCHPVFNTLRTTRDKHQWMVVKFLT